MSGGGVFVGADLVLLSPGVTLVALNKASTLNPNPQTLNPKLSARNPEP